MKVDVQLRGGTVGAASSTAWTRRDVLGGLLAAVGAGAVGGLLLLLWQSPRLTLLAMAVVPFVAIGAAVYGRSLRALSAQVQDALARSTEIAEESLGGIRTVRSFAREAVEVARYDGAVEESFRLASRRALMNGVFAGVAGFVVG